MEGGSPGNALNHTALLSFFSLEPESLYFIKTASSAVSGAPGIEMVGNRDTCVHRVLPIRGSSG